MQPKQQQKKPEKRTVQELKGQRELPDQHVMKKKQGQKQVAATPGWNSTPTTVNPLPSHAATEYVPEAKMEIWLTQHKVRCQSII